MEEIVKELKEHSESDFADFQSKLTPGTDREKFLGVRTPYLRKMAKRIIKDQNLCENFLAELPHTYFDENQLHTFLVAEIKDYDNCIARVEEFLPYIDNWATCDQATPKALAKNKKDLYKRVKKWLKSKETYVIRYAIGTLLCFFLDEDFDKEHLDLVCKIKSEEYYVNMMIAWYIATALAKQWEATLPVIEENRLEPWTHNKAIQKAKESYRITPEQKEYLNTLKQKKGAK